MRLRLVAIALCAGVVLLSGCSSASDDPKPSPTASVDADGLSPEQREVADVVDAYYAALLGRGEAKIEDALGDTVTDDLRAKLVRDEGGSVEGAGLQRLGEYTIHVDGVRIFGDKATFTGCSDTSRLFLVKRGETMPGDGSSVGATSLVELELVRTDGIWRVSQPHGERADSC